uniref:Battenin n=1 Tax=Meloidogyne javanica TaxID=6303 RepID=A0A915LQI1_MELJA
MISNSGIDPEADDNSSPTNFSSGRREANEGRNLLAFWLLGLCNNFGYVVMLSAAKDILEKSEESPIDSVVFASLGAGLGEITYLSLSSHFHNDVISFWSSGTGGAGIFGSLAFAALTDHRMLGLNAKQALLTMLVVPTILALTYGFLLQSPPSTHRVWLRWPSFNGMNISIFGRRRTGFSSTTTESFTSSAEDDLQRLLHGDRLDARQTLRKNVWRKIRMAKPLLRFMVPLAIVYFSEYFINQGLLELLIFNCASSFNLSPMQQYRWYQVLYQGLLGGSAYVNTFSAIHRTVSKANREFCISFATIADSLGIVFAGFSSIYAHNFICDHRW